MDRGAAQAPDVRLYQTMQGATTTKRDVDQGELIPDPREQLKFRKESKRGSTEARRGLFRHLIHAAQCGTAAYPNEDPHQNGPNEWCQPAPISQWQR